MIKKDTTLKALVKGINVILHFNKHGVIDKLEELNTNYLQDISIDTINNLRYNAKSKAEYTVKAVLTINRKNLNLALTKYKTSLVQTIHDCLIDDEYVQYISLLIVGTLDNIDRYDEFYDCELCKYFPNFYRVPKIKLKEDISDEDLSIILAGWYDLYLFDGILINGDSTISLLNLSDKFCFDKNQILWKRNNDTYIPYLEHNYMLTPISLSDICFTRTDNVERSVYYKFNNKIIFNNILQDIIDSLSIKKLTNVSFINGKFKIIKGSENNGRN